LLHFFTADLQVVIVAVGVHLVTGVHIEHRVQTLGGAGILFKFLHLAGRDMRQGETRDRERQETGRGKRQGET